MREAYPRDEALTAIILGFQNKAMIADQVMPRTSPLDSPRYKYQYYAPGQFAYVPDTRVGRRTKVNEVEFKGESRHGETQEYALKHAFVPRDFDGVKNPAAKRASATEALSNLLELSREVRVADMVLNPANYGNNAIALSANDKLDDDATDPVKLIREALKACRIRPNIAVMGTNEWDALAAHPRILAAVVRAAGVVGSIGAAGIATREEVARLFGLQEIIVGEALVSSSYADNAVFKATWSGGIAFHRRDTSAISGVTAGMNNGMTWGFTAHFEKFANKYNDDTEGTRGVEYVRVVDDCEEAVVSTDCGVLLTEVLSA
ncbi:hypothetical protein DTO96_102159 [Ephemeroptericola cinctiostellae]|uniref:Phage capsid protein n=1 Tax=Ephemeroptericola cinctiostellae TaxID=2268024 RepID=A0A345DDG7_9BURK|nr:phage capsid protein [Ephemeroptericola cinctiostellae]AXF86405.1 hypothetical protein DTO96_102159 [Ephemeroptericola cinctiostellae]